MVDGVPFFRMQEVPGEPNSETHIDLIERRGGLGRYRLEPSTGKKHQLRVHMAALGTPILNDVFYPVAMPCKGDDFSRPLQLLAKSIQFRDPFSGNEMFFETRQQLHWPE
jgi:tRNA pseudouridine32 synthase/23S rRNA pseudouridine746 synthase